MQSIEWPSVNNCATKSDDAQPIVNNNDCIIQNVIKVTTVIILNYGYGINSIEQCVN